MPVITENMFSLTDCRKLKIDAAFLLEKNSFPPSLLLQILLRHFIHCLVAPLSFFQHLLESVELEDRVGRIPPFPCKEWSCRTVSRQVCLYLREKTSPTAESGVKGNDAEFGVLPDMESRGNVPLHSDTAALHTSAPRGDQ